MSSNIRPFMATQDRASCSLSVIVPTRNEAGNVRELSARLLKSLAPLGVRWELIFVDDSDDETPDCIRSMSLGTSIVRLVHRSPGERQGGLAGAVVRGFAVAEGSSIVVMDGDLQHPPECVPSLVAPILSELCTMAVGSRFVEFAHADGLAGPYRRLVSEGSRLVVRSIFPAIWQVRDPMSGFFAFRREVVEDAVLAPKGFKILLEVLIRGDWDSIREVPIDFAPRQNGGSKAGWHEGVRLLHQIARLRLSSSASPGRRTSRERESASGHRPHSGGSTVLSVVGDASHS